MPREAGLFDAAGGSPVEAFFLLRAERKQWGHAE
jgi:hypothetical protein